jgi:Ca-activated chloride channel family protein
MKINPDDPKWTAYVLGELSDAERAELERELESSTAAREAVDEIRLTTALLKDEFARESAAGLTPAQKQAIGAAAAAAEPRYKGWLSFRVPAFATLAVTVCIVVGSVGVSSLLRSRQTASLMSIDTADMPVRQIGEAPLPKSEIYSAASRDAAPVIREKDQAAQPGQQRQQGQQGQAFNELQDREIFGYRRSESERLPALKTAEPAPPAPAMAPAAPADIPDRKRLNTEAYDYISDNPFIRAAQEQVATFSIDVDTASYANLRRFITMNQLPPKDAVRIEEMLNYFTYDYAPPTGPQPIAAYTEVAAAPWEPSHRLVRVAIKGKEVDLAKRPASNLVFLIDVSGSMNDSQKLPLLKSSMKLMVDKLMENDRVAIVVYAGASGMVLPPTSGDKKAALLSAIDNLASGGSTNGAAGIQLAYDTAIANFIKGGINRVILATDGDFNVGVTNEGDLTRLIEDKAKSGVFLTVLGFGMGNLKDSTLEKLADRGNGNYAYIDTMNEARKVLVEELGGTLMTIAKDVKVQIEFNPAEVNAYRLIGYENRVLRNEDFNNDQKDAGDMGAGHTVTALFEVVPRGVEIALPRIEPLRYRAEAGAVAGAAGAAAVRADLLATRGEMLNVKIRYKEPNADTSQMLAFPVRDRGTAFNSATTDFRFAAAVASFGMVLRDSPHKGQSNLNSAIEIAEKSRGADRGGYRDEFIQLVRKTAALKNQ